MLFTTYLGFLRNYKPNSPKKFYYVMRNRGNNQVAPTKEMVDQMLSDKKRFEEFGQWETRGVWMCWPEYKKKYLKLLESEQAKNWMRRVAAESLMRDVVLVCFEKDSMHCHRRLLAEEIAKTYPKVNYVGELTNE